MGFKRWLSKGPSFSGDYGVSDAYCGMRKFRRQSPGLHEHDAREGERIDLSSASLLLSAFAWDRLAHIELRIFKRFVPCSVGIGAGQRSKVALQNQVQV